MSSPPPKQSLSSPTSGNSPPPVLPTPSSSTSVRQSINKPALLKKELEQQLKEKQKQLQESSSGIGKNVLARQISQLQDRIKEIDANIDVQPTSSIDRLRSLESSYRSHPLSPGISSIRNKEKLLNQRSPGTNTTGEPLPSPSTSTLLPPPHGHDSTSLLPLPPPPTGSTPTKRRSKIPNTDRRNTDIEFATEIGQGLLLEVRKMQALLQEKEEKLRILENQKADLERAAEAMAKQMRQREENEEKLKEETWNLELAKQELVISVTELQTNLNKANAEQNRLAKQVNDLRSEIEQLRDKEEKLTATMENMKQRHEQDMSSIRRQAASFQREKQEQSKKIEALTSELAIAKAQSRIGKHASSDIESTSRRVGSTGEQSENDQASTTLAVKSDQSPSVSPPSSPKISPARNQAMEVETLKTSLGHAHRMVSNLRSNLHKEKMEKFELKKLLEESRESLEQLQNDPRLWVDAGPSRVVSSTSTKDQDGQPRRTHKASFTSGKRRGKAQRRPRLSKNKTTSDYSYSSLEESDQDSLDESDVKPAFTSLGSELSQSQKKVYVDAEMNTDPIDTEPVKGTEIFTQTEPEPTTTTEMATQTDDVPSFEISVQTNALPETTEIAVQTVDSEGIEMSIQTDDEPLPQTQDSSVQTELETCEMEIQTDDAVVSEIWTQTDDSVTFETSTQTDDQLVTETSTQTDVPDSLEAFVQTDLPTASEILVQTDLPLVTEISTQTESCVLEQSSLVSFEAPVSGITLEDCAQPPLDIKPEDPSVAMAAMAAATAAAVQEARNSAIGSAVDQETQYDVISSQDQETQYDVVISQDQDTQYEAVDVIDTETQYEAEPGLDCTVQSEIMAVDASIQMDPVETNDTSVQYEPVQTNDISVQSEVVETNDMFVQSDAVETKDSSIQFEAVEAKDISIQSEPIEGNDVFVQSEAVETKDSVVQYEPVEYKDISVQSEPVQAKDTLVQSEPAKTIDSTVQYEPVETKDASVQYDLGLVDLGNMSASNSTDKYVAAAALAAAATTVPVVDSTNKDHVTAALPEKSAEPVITEQRNISSDKSTPNGFTQTEESQQKNIPKNETTPTSLTQVDASKDQNDDSTVSQPRNVSNDISTPLVHAQTDDKQTPPQSHTDEDGPLNSQVDAPKEVSQQRNISKDETSPKLVDTLKDQLLDNQEQPKAQQTNINKDVTTPLVASTPEEQVLSNQQPTTQQRSIVNVDDQDKSATAQQQTKLNGQEQQQRSIAKDQDEQSTAQQQPKMYSQAETDALVASAVALALANAAAAKERELLEKDEPRNDADSAVVSQYSDALTNPDEEVHNQSNIVVHVPATTTGDNVKEKELANGPSVIHENKPSATPTVTVEDNESYNSSDIMDIPARPSNPPPVDLLSKIGASSSMIDSRSMSPVSNHSYNNNKGKAPYDPYYEQSTLEKKPSLGASSYSTTNDQLQSIHSSQFGPRSGLTSTDPSVINLITQTMIGDWLWKYTRRVVGGGISEKRHKRYFWIHPYTRTLYWSTNAPGVNGGETKAKSALIENVKAVPEYANNGLPNVSLMIQTSQRQLKLTAPNMDKHETWFEAISYLLARNENGSTSILNDTSKRVDSNNRSIGSAASGSLLKRPSFRIFQQPSVSTSTHSMGEHVHDDEDDEPLEDVRMCCNGKHHVSKLEKDHTHRHHYRKRKSQTQQQQ